MSSSSSPTTTSAAAAAAAAVEGISGGVGATGGISTCAIATAIVVIGPQSFQISDDFALSLANQLGIKRITMATGKDPLKHVKSSCLNSADFVLQIPAGAFKKVPTYFRGGFIF